MASNQRAEAHERPSSRRTMGDRQRRRALADAAAGFPPKIERFKCVIYVFSPEFTDSDQLLRECEGTAQAFGWDVVDVITEADDGTPPRGREGLKRALGYLRSGEAGAILTVYRSMISPSTSEYTEIAREVEENGGFVYAKNPTSPENAGMP
ncbi:recombinase family protein [Streptomyces olivoreticuli]